jgi:ssDNA-binding Zn-finger/Zn-ribbon topoisomerase 1
MLELRDYQRQAVDSVFDEAANDNAEDVFWSGLEIDRLPRTALEASNIGVAFFYTGEPCVHGHNAPKYTKGGRCVVCARQHSARQQSFEYRGNNRQSRANIIRAIAASGGKRTYAPESPCVNGHRLRFVSTNNCVECDEISRKKHKERARERRLIKEYGITLEDREKIIEAQGRVCPICLEDIADAKNAHIDHCHSSGSVRGVLCSRCNQAIGLLRENEESLKRAISYLNYHSSKGKE